MQSKQLRRRQKLNNQLSKSKKNGSEDDGRSGVAAVSGGRKRGDGCGDGRGNGGGRQGGGAAEETAATVVAECSRHRPKLLTTIAAPAKAGAIPAQTMTVEAATEAVAEVAAEVAAVARRIVTPPPTGGGLRSYRIAPTLVVRWSARLRTLPPRWRRRHWRRQQRQHRRRRRTSF